MNKTTDSDDSRMLMRSQLLLVKAFVEQMDIVRQEYVKRGLDKERDFLEEFLKGK